MLGDSSHSTVLYILLFLGSSNYVHSSDIQLYKHLTDTHPHDKNPYSLLHGAIFNDTLLNNLHFLGNSVPMLKYNSLHNHYITYTPSYTPWNIKLLYFLFHRTGTALESIVKLHPTSYLLTTDTSAVIQGLATLCIAQQQDLTVVAKQYEKIQKQLQPYDTLKIQSLQGMLNKIMTSLGNDDVIRKEAHHLTNQFFAPKKPLASHKELAESCQQFIKQACSPLINEAARQSEAVFNFQKLDTPGSHSLLQMLLGSVQESMVPSPCFSSTTSLYALTAFLYRYLLKNTAHNPSLFLESLHAYYKRVPAFDTTQEGSSSTTHPCAIAHAFLELARHTKLPLLTEIREVHYRLTALPGSSPPSPVHYNNCTEVAIANWFLYNSYNPLQNTHTLSYLKEVIHHPFKEEYATEIEHCFQDPHNALKWAHLLANIPSAEYLQATQNYLCEAAPTLDTLITIITHFFNIPPRIRKLPPKTLLEYMVSSPCHESTRPWKLNNQDHTLRKNRKYIWYTLSHPTKKTKQQFGATKDPLHAFFEYKIEKKQLPSLDTTAPYTYLCTNNQKASPVVSQEGSTLYLDYLSLRYPFLKKYLFNKILPTLSNPTPPLSDSSSFLAHLSEQPLAVGEKFFLLGLRSLWDNPTLGNAQRCITLLHQYESFLHHHQKKSVIFPLSSLIMQQVFSLLKTFIMYGKRNQIAEALRALPLLLPQSQKLYTAPAAPLFKQWLQEEVLRNKCFSTFPCKTESKAYFWKTAALLWQSAEVTAFSSYYTKNFWGFFSATYETHEELLEQWCTNAHWHHLYHALQAPELNLKTLLLNTLYLKNVTTTPVSFFILAALLKQPEAPYMYGYINQLLLTVSSSTLPLFLSELNGTSYLEIFYTSLTAEHKKSMLHYLKTHLKKLNNSSTSLELLKKFEDIVTVLSTRG